MMITVLPDCFKVSTDNKGKNVILTTTDALKAVVVARIDTQHKASYARALIEIQKKDPGKYWNEIQAYRRRVAAAKYV